jgi:hypothetical protein
MGYSVDANFGSVYEEGLLFTAHQILAELGEKFKGDIRNSMSGQIANDAHIQGVEASMFIGLLIACENSLKWVTRLSHLVYICWITTLNIA